jgi:hypothetical protein
MSFSEIFTGFLYSIDQYRYQLESEGATTVLLLHRRFSDFFAFLKHYGFDFFTPKQSITTPGVYTKARFVTFTRSRFLKGGVAPMLLPTEFLMFDIDMTKNSSDASLIRGPLSSLHASFCDSPSYSDDAVQGLFCEVLEISDVKLYPSQRAKEFRVVTLRLMHRDFPVQRGGGDGVLVLILFDDQVHLADLWDIGLLLWFHRPCLTVNTEEPIFGMTIENTVLTRVPGMNMQGSLVYHISTPIKKCVAECALPSSTTRLLHFHIVIGAITVVNRVILDSDSTISDKQKGDDRLKYGHDLEVIQKYLFFLVENNHYNKCNNLC